MKDMIRIGNGQGFWGDSVDAPVNLVKDGPLDYLTLDYLAEVTLSIMQRQKLKNPDAGYARDFVGLIQRILPEIRGNGLKVITNAGGVNPHACRKELLKLFVDPENMIKIPEPKYKVKVDFDKIKKDIPDDIIEKNWQKFLDNVSYDKERLTITKTRIESVEAKRLQDKRLEIIKGPKEFDISVEGKWPRDVLENKFKDEVMSIASGLLIEAGYGSMLKAKLYVEMIKHIKKKIFG